MRIGFYLWRITSAKGKSLFSLTQPILPPDGEMGRFFWGGWSGVSAVAVALGGRETLDFGEFKETWDVVLLLLGTFGGFFEGLGTAKCYFRVWMSLRNSEGIFLSIGNLGFSRIAKLGGFLGYQKPHFFAHRETWGVFLALAETPIAF